MVCYTNRTENRIQYYLCVPAPNAIRNFRTIVWLFVYFKFINLKTSFIHLLQLQCRINICLKLFLLFLFVTGNLYFRCGLQIVCFLCLHNISICTPIFNYVQNSLWLTLIFKIFCLWNLNIGLSNPIKIVFQIGNHSY